MATHTIIPQTDWYCPSCHVEDQTSEPRPHTRMHQCVNLGGLTVPMAKQGTKARHILNERGDYTNGDHGIRFHNGQAIMSTSLERMDGSNDVAVYPATATMRVT